ncbi:hypothetical protein [Microbacterium murale]|uniref:Tetratricopeptide (TPR) repeat protein n=1 Tax=Microbacterium murale TaxID=1081040 RepID=A0ABU0P7G9_9MICO|nr:hypothetical protein [Microbacterium murale]MDQ0642626.1 tetratricopeptide (TPR) repeat protein [Microbacterium murale]
MTDDDLRDGPRSVRGRVPTSEAWIPVRDRNNTAADLLNSGDNAEAARLLQEAIELTDDSDDPEARDLRSRALLNLAAARSYEADLAEALRLAEESIRTASGVLDEIGDVRASRTVLVNAMLCRAQVLAQSDRLEGALAQADEAAAELAAHDDIHQPELLHFTMHDARAGILIMLGRLEDAEADARRSLDLALRIDATLTAGPYMNLGAIAQRTGDLHAAHEFIGLAAAAQQNDGDLITRQSAIENRARNAMQLKRLDEAADLFREAAALAKQAGLVTRLAACRMGVAAVHLESGNPALSAKVMRELIAELGTDGAAAERREAYGFLGDAESKRGKFALADEAYRTARDLSRSAHERCRVDLRRAEMQAEWASFTPLPRKRMARLRTGLEMAIPVLLATEALRGGFRPGPIRERWSLQVAAPARELAFRLAVTLGDGQVLFELIENAAASATLQAEAIEAQLPSEDSEAAAVTPVTTLSPEDDVAADVELPAAASGFVGAMSASSPVRFAPPPRVVAMPGAEPALEKWIRIAEAEYGVTVRSETVVASW